MTRTRRPRWTGWAPRAARPSSPSTRTRSSPAWPPVAPDNTTTPRLGRETMGSTSKGHIAIIGAGPAGMATALAGHRAGFAVSILERYPEIKPAGNILNLWPPPQKVLG